MECFAAYDEDNTGFISIRQLRQVETNLGESLSNDDLRDVLAVRTVLCCYAITLLALIFMRLVLSRERMG